MNRSISGFRYLGNDLFLIQFRNTRGNYSQEIVRVDDFALIELMDAAKQGASER